MKFLCKINVGLAEVVENLPSKHEALSLNPSAIKTKQASINRHLQSVSRSCL
jgi:hypothetical protein